MEKTRWQCTYCGQQLDSSNPPSKNFCTSKSHSQHDWVPLEKTDNRIKKEFWRCIYCGCYPTGTINGYPKNKPCQARKIQLPGTYENLACVWTKLDKNTKQWRCFCCNVRATHFDENGLPKAERCTNNSPNNHIWKK